MKKRLRSCFALLLVTMILMVTGLVTADDTTKKKDLPNIDYLIGIARMTSGWTTPPMGNPEQRFIKDISTGKTYLVEVGYWSDPVVLSEF